MDVKALLQNFIEQKLNEKKATDYETLELDEAIKVGDKVTYGAKIAGRLKMKSANITKVRGDGKFELDSGAILDKYDMVDSKAEIKQHHDFIVESINLDEGKIIANGLLRDKPFRKTFKSVEAMKKWADLEDADVRGYHAAPGKGEDTKESANLDESKLPIKYRTFAMGAERVELDENQRSLDAHKFKQAAKVKAGIPLRKPGESLAAYVTRKAKAEAKMKTRKPNLMKFR